MGLPTEVNQGILKQRDAWIAGLRASCKRLDEKWESAPPEQGIPAS